MVWDGRGGGGDGRCVHILDRPRSVGSGLCIFS